MRVCMLLRNPFTHDARVEREATTLVRAGHAVTIVAVRRDASLPEREVRDGVAVERLRVTGRAFGVARSAVRGRTGNASPGISRGTRVRSLVVQAGRTVSTIRFNLKAARRAAALRPDVYHCHDFNTLLAGILAARRHPAPIVYDSHELYAHLNVPRPTKLRTRIVEAIEARGVRRASAVITVSDSYADHLARRYGIARPVVVRNIPRPEPAGAAPTEIPAALAGPGVKLLYVGGITRNRGIEESIDALRLLPDARLVLMGPSMPPYDEEFAALANARGVGGRVAFVAPVPSSAVPSVAAHATVGLALFRNVGLSHELTLPNKIFEYLHAGLPIVGSDFPEFRRIIDGENVGLTCATDPDAIANAVRAITGDGETLEKMRRNARTAAGLYTWEREASKLLDVYEGPAAVAGANR